MKNLICAAIFLFSCGDSMPSGLPENFSWGSVDLDGDGVNENYLTDIKNQDGPNCLLFAMVGLLEVQYKVEHRLATELNLSEQNMYNCLRYDNGDIIGVGRLFYHFKNFGVMEEHFAPYNFWVGCHNCIDPLPSQIGMEPVNQIPFYGADKIKDVISYEETKKISYEEKRLRLMNALQSGPIQMDVHSYLGFETDPISGLKICQNPGPSGHALIIVGYEDNGAIFLAKNSWADGKLLRILFEGADRCGFAHQAFQISETWMKRGVGKKFCVDPLDDDQDQIPTATDNCPWIKNGNQKNQDKDLFGDACDECPISFEWFTGASCAK